MPSRHESAHPLLSNIRPPGRVTREADCTFVDHERPSRMVGNEPVVFQPVRLRLPFARRVQGPSGRLQPVAFSAIRLSSSRLIRGCPSRVNEFAVIAAKTTRWRRPGFRVVLAFENWLVLADRSALAESLVSFPTAKQEPSGEPEGTRASDKTLRRRRQTFVASH